MKINILEAVSNHLGRTGLKIEKVSPEIFIGAGIGFMVASTVFACKATLKADEVLKKRDTDIEKAKRLKEIVESGDEKYTKDNYSDKDYREDVFISYVGMVKGFVKIYWPAITCGIIGTASILYGHDILTKRNVAIAAAYKTVKEGYSEYRKRVIEELGEDADKRFKYGLQKKDIEIEQSKEDGSVKKKNIKNAEVIDGYSKNAKFFDASSRHWEKSPEYNLHFLRNQQAYANQLLQTRGHVFLNEIYDMLDIPRTKEGAVEGWVKEGAGFIDFGIYELYSEAARDFVNGYENVILLDFNVDGNILDLI